MKKFKHILVNISILIFSILLIFVLGESVIRISLFFKGRNDFKEVMKNLPETREGDDVGNSLARIVQPNRNPKIIYELRPDMRVIFRNGMVRTNDQGWRSDVNYLPKKEKNAVRIVGLGDSYMFGQGVSQNEDMMSVLKNELNKRYPQKKWEVINTAVPGYNTTMEIETLKEKALDYRPDIVVIEFIGNDFYLPNFIYEFDDWLNTEKIYSLEFLKKRIELASKNFRLLTSPESSSYHKSIFEVDLLKVPEQYRNMVGWDAYVNAMQELKALQEKHKFIVISFITLQGRDSRLSKIFDLSKELGFYTLHNSVYNQRDLTLVLSKKDWHPSVKGHKRHAELLLSFMIKEGIIDRYLD